MKGRYYKLDKNSNSFKESIIKSPYFNFQKKFNEEDIRTFLNYFEKTVKDEIDKTLTKIDSCKEIKKYNKIYTDFIDEIFDFLVKIEYVTEHATNKTSFSYHKLTNIHDMLYRSIADFISSYKPEMLDINKENLDAVLKEEEYKSKTTKMKVSFAIAIASTSIMCALDYFMCKNFNRSLICYAQTARNIALISGTYGFSNKISLDRKGLSKKTLEFKEKDLNFQVINEEDRQRVSSRMRLL